MINPFINRTEHNLTTRELIKTIIMTPIAIAKMTLTFIMVFFMLITLYVSSIGYSSNDENLSKCSRCFFVINQFIGNCIDNIKMLCCKRKINTTNFHEMSKIRRCLLFFVQLESRFIMLILGYWWIKEKFPDNKKCIMFPSYLERPNAPKICVANHVSFIDAFYFLSRCVPRSIVIQANVAKPFVWAMNAFSPILVPVTQQQREQLGEPRDQIRRNLNTDVLKRPLIIFPEGGTKQSNTLIKFQDGAFLDIQPVQPVGLKYTYNNFDSSWTNDVSPMWLMFRMCCQFYNSLTVEYYDVVKPEQENSTIDIVIMETDNKSTDKIITNPIIFDKTSIDSLKKKVSSMYENDSFFTQTSYTLSDSRITSKLFKMKKIPVDYVCSLLENGNSGVSDICKKSPITRDQLEKLICKFYSLNNYNDKLDYHQVCALFTNNERTAAMRNCINIRKLFNNFKYNNVITFKSVIEILISAKENNDKIISCFDMSVDDISIYDYIISQIM